jgi:hypothetical protein
MHIIDSQKSQENWRGLFRDTNERYPWGTKLEKVAWRGSLSATYTKTLTSIRWRASKFAYQLNSTLFDVGLTSIPSYVTDHINVNVSEVGGLKKGLPMSEFQKFRAILDMDGNSWSSRFT